MFVGRWHSNDQICSGQTQEEHGLFESQSLWFRP